MINAILRYIVSNLLTLLGLTQGVSEQVAHATQETTPYRVQDQVIGISQAVESGTSGFIALHNQLLTISDAIAALPQVGDVVVLPTSPPTGYGGASVNDVWSAELGADGLIASDLLEQSGHLAASTITSRGLIAGTSKYFYLAGADIASIPSHIISSSPPTVSPANIVADDTRLTWLTREWPIFSGWSLDPYTDLYFYVENAAYNDCQWRCVVDEEWFARLKATALNLTSQNNTPPVWPGLANVTLSTPVAVSPGLTITEPMDGVIVNLSSEPPRAAFFTFDDVNSYRNLGALSFFTDDGEQELPQPLGFTSAIYSPRAMTRAAGVKVRSVGGVVGTVTPWTISA